MCQPSRTLTDQERGARARRLGIVTDTKASGVIGQLPRPQVDMDIEIRIVTGRPSRAQADMQLEATERRVRHWAHRQLALVRAQPLFLNLRSVEERLMQEDRMCKCTSVSQARARGRFVNAMMAQE